MRNTTLLARLLSLDGKILMLRPIRWIWDWTCAWSIALWGTVRGRHGDAIAEYLHKKNTPESESDGEDVTEPSQGGDDDAESP